VGSVTVEVELQEGENDVQAWVEGALGAKIRIGIEEPAQTVTVTQVAEVPIVGAPRGCIGTRDGHVSVKLGYGRTLLEIGEDGQIDSLVAEGGGQGVMAMSRHGGYGVIRTGSLSGGEWAVHVYDPGWNEVATWEQRGDRIGAISDSGNTVVAFRSEEMPDEPPGPVVGYDIFDQAGTLLFAYPGAGEHLLYGDDLVVSPDGLTLAQFVPPVFRLWRRDGTVQWETESRDGFAVGNGGVAVQSAGDSLLFYGPDGAVSRVYAENEPKSPGSAEAAMSPQGQVGMHLGVGIMAGRRDGPQSCWRFTAPAPGWVGAAWSSDDGRWAFGASQGIYGPSAQQGAWLIGAGGETLWDALLEGGMAPLSLTTFTEDGGYFFYTEHLLPAGDRCRLMRIDIADRGR
ncbi:hypothetical protein JXA88_06460, partial [Candidatus Fermentibacteria bacterium]|nr:hypothetical protein [Candidatus Fermentibacteria bacterium]